MPPALHRLLLRLFAALPRGVRRRLVRWGSPSYTVGAVGVVEREDGRVLLIRQRYRHHWGLPGGLLSRGEAPDAAVRREIAEEVGLRVDVVGEPVVVVDPSPQRVDVTFRVVPSVGEDPDGARPTSPEIVETRWFPRDDLPRLQHETRAALAALVRGADRGRDGAADDRSRPHG